MTCADAIRTDFRVSGFSDHRHLTPDRPERLIQRIQGGEYVIYMIYVIYLQYDIWPAYG